MFVTFATKKKEARSKKMSRILIVECFLEKRGELSVLKSIYRIQNILIYNVKTFIHRSHSKSLKGKVNSEKGNKISENLTVNDCECCKIVTKPKAFHFLL